MRGLRQGWDGGSLVYGSESAVPIQTEKDTDEPRPGPIGRVARALRLNEGLIVHDMIGLRFRIGKKRGILSAIFQVPIGCFWGFVVINYARQSGEPDHPMRAFLPATGVIDEILKALWALFFSPWFSWGWRVGEHPSSLSQ